MLLKNDLLEGYNGLSLTMLTNGMEFWLLWDWQGEKTGQEPIQNLIDIYSNLHSIVLLLLAKPHLAQILFP